MIKKKKAGSGAKALSAKEIEVLRWVQEGKTNDEIAVILGKSKWTAKYHIKNVFRKLNVTNRASAISAAIGMGVLPPTEPSEYVPEKKKLKIGVVGCGKGGTAVLKLFKENPSVEIMWATDRDVSAPGLAVAGEMNVPTGVDYKMFLGEKVDVIVNLSGSKSVSEDLRRIINPDTELMGGLSAKIMWQLFEERRRRVEDRERTLKEHEALYHLGLVVESIHSLNDAGYAIVDYAMKLTNTQAGSIALFDEKKEDMVLIASKGMSSAFKKNDRWEIRKGGLTSRILNQNGPLYMEDIRESSELNPLLMKEGVRALLAAPLMVEGRIVGILYVNDFKKRKFRAEHISLFSLLTIYAGLTIERVKAIEETRLLSITDGLTNLYNQRHLMEQLQRELQRAARHKKPLAVIMFDIDNFKTYNDSYGHIEGNKVLKTIARMLKKSTRLSDTVGRFGGEEFCLVMPEISKEGAKAFASRIVKEIGKYPMPNRKVTLSGGVSTFPHDGKTHALLLKKADERLYKAKNAGRNRLVAE
ncbi:MAG: diguanylate cyclase [Thermodesulfobacteriota bacterium]